MKFLLPLTASLLSVTLAQKVSTDATCGGSGKNTCLGSSFGNCCSSAGWCGSTSAYCGTGCQSAYGNCGSNNPSSSSKAASSTKVSTSSSSSKAVSSTKTSTSAAPSSTKKATSTTSSATATASGTVSQCLNGKNVPYKMSSDAQYSALAEPYNLRLVYKPVVIVVPTTNQHVQDAVTCAAQTGTKVQAKSGGHSYASFSSGGKDGSMVIDLESLQTVQLDKSSGIVQVGGGVRLGNLANGIYNQGQKALPHGTCPGVGIGGHSTHGGYGHTSRHWGLALDTIVAADVVLANGTLVKASSTAYPDVFWAVRGAAESFGVVTNFYMQTQPAPTSVTYFAFPYANVFASKASFTNTFLRVQEIATNSSIMDDNISFGIYMDGTSFSLSGAYFGSVSDFNSKIKPEFLRALGSGVTVDTPTVKSYGWIDYLVLVSGETTIVEPTTGYDAHDNFYAKSVTVPEKDGFKDTALNALYDHISSAGDVSWYIIANVYGGPGSKINSKDTTFAAYADRDSLWVLQNYGENATSVDFVNGINSAIIGGQPQTSFGAYLNYVDPGYDAATAHKLYYGDALYAKLLALKKQVDPKSVFWNPQAIGA